MPRADVDEYRRVELSRRSLLATLERLGYRRWLVTHYPPKDPGLAASWCLWPQAVAEATPDEWERLFTTASFDARLIAADLVRQGYTATAQRSAGLPYVRVLAPGEAGPWPAESEDGWVSDRLRLDLIGADDPAHPDYRRNDA